MFIDSENGKRPEMDPISTAEPVNYSGCSKNTGKNAIVCAIILTYGQERKSAHSAEKKQD